MRGKGNRRERRDSNCCEMKGEGGGEGRVEGETGWCSVCEHYQMSWWPK